MKISDLNKEAQRVIANMTDCYNEDNNPDRLAIVALAYQQGLLDMLELIMKQLEEQVKMSI